MILSDISELPLPLLGGGPPQALRTSISIMPIIMPGFLFHEFIAVSPSVSSMALVLTGIPELLLKVQFRA
jgi:hypothetical protein